MYGPRGAMLGSGGVSDGFEGTKRQRMTESNPYLAVSGSGSSDVYDGLPKMPRMLDSNPFFGMSGTGGFHQPYGAYGGVDSSMLNFPVIRLRGLPFECADFDVYNFFQGLDIVDCLLVNKNGRFSGEAFVVFASPMQAGFALQKDHDIIGKRYIEVFKGRRQEYYQAIAAHVNYGTMFDNDYHRISPPARPPKRSREDKEQMEYTEILKLRGLPYSATESQIVGFFGEEFGLVEDNVHIALRADGKATGEAYVEFASTEAAVKAMSKDKMTIGKRYVELFPSTPGELAMVTSRFRQ